MVKNTELIEKREELKQRLANGEYKSLVRVIADNVNLMLQKFTRSGPLPFWFGIVMMVVIISLLGLLLSIVMGNSIFDYDRDFLLYVTLGFLIVFFIAIELNINLASNFYREHFLDSLESATDLADIQDWLDASLSNNSFKIQFFFGLVVSIVVVLLIGIFNSAIVNQLNIGFFISNWLLIILAGSYFHIFYKSILMTGNFRHYDIKLYQANPSRSEVLDHLIDLFNFNMYTVAVLVTLVTFIIINFFGWTTSNIILLALLVWGPTVALFVSNQYMFSKIITRAKWKTLNKIQMQIEELQEQEPILSEETLAHIDKLMDYHDRIEATKDSALNVRAGLNFLNSLLLPLLAFVIANGNEIVEFFFGE